jgi:histidinol-phosphate/aromatic aminotransferase/cobyric acid decarboxylase-like protein
MPLAVSSYDRLEALGDDKDLLNLAWTVDERHHLSVDLLDLVARELRAEVEDALPFVTRYFVKDPYGEQLLAGPVARLFGAPHGSLAVTCGAGVGPLLQSLTALAGGAPTYVASDVYSDLPFWAERWGSRCVTFADRAGGADPGRIGAQLSAEEHADNAAALGARLVALERPCLTPDLFADLPTVRQLCAALASHGIPVVIDESNANYWPICFSAVRLVGEAANLVVVRGLSKAFGLGGLRLGYCVSQPALAAELRTVIPPLLASSVSLRLGLAVLALGDITGPLRRRIRVRRAETTVLLDSVSDDPTIPASEFLPYLLFGDCPERALARLRGLGVLGKLHPVWSAAQRRLVRVGRISVPLDDDRMDRLRVLIGAAR